jgi:hypothetical protein
MVRIAVIGAGQLGSRHLQALSLLDRPASIQVVDPSAASLEVSRERFGQVAGNSNVQGVEYLEDIGGLADELDVAVVATNADVRRRVVEDLLARKKVRYIILEKVLFQRPEDFEEAGRLLEANGVRAWVNCPRRMWPYYRKINELFHGARRVEYSVSGSQLGIGCNAIHYLDHLAFLTGQSDVSLYGDLLDSEVAPSKRAGFVEFTGTLHGYVGSNPIAITSYGEGEVPPLILITSDRARCLIREGEGKAWVAESARGWSWEEVSFTVPYQSQLTHLVVQKILDSDGCDLTGYQESAKLHLPFINTLTDFVKQQKSLEDFKTCPIT